MFKALLVMFCVATITMSYDLTKDSAVCRVTDGVMAKFEANCK